MKFPKLPNITCQLQCGEKNLFHSIFIKNRALNFKGIFFSFFFGPHGIGVRTYSFSVSTPLLYFNVSSRIAVRYFYHNTFIVLVHNSACGEVDSVRLLMANLRYYATFKVRNLIRCSTKLIHVCKKLPFALDCRQTKYSQ